MRLLKATEAYRRLRRGYTRARYNPLVWVVDVDHCNTWGRFPGLWTVEDGTGSILYGRRRAAM
jgi:hypothetical protein